MLDSLTIFNGVMTPSFDKYNNTYSVIINNDATSLDITYKVNPDLKVSIFNNESIRPGNNEVFINVIDKNIVNTYKLLVYKEKEMPVFKEIQKTSDIPYEYNEYLPYEIGVVSFVFMIFVFFSLFSFKKKK